MCLLAHFVLILAIFDLTVLMKSFNMLSNNVVCSDESAKMNVTIAVMDQDKKKVIDGSCSRVSHSLPCFPNLKPSKEFLQKTPIMSVSPSQWQEGVPSPIRRGALTPNQEAFSLLARFTSGLVRMDGDVVQHLSITQGNKSIGSNLSELLWLTPSTKKMDGSVIHSKKAKIATPKQTKANKLAQKQPCTKIPDSDIKIENIIPGSPIYIPYKKIKVTGKGKHSKKIKLINETDKPVGMAHTKLTLTREEWDAIAARAKCTTDWAKKLATKQTEETNKALSTPKSIPNHKTVDGGKTPCKKLAIMVPRKTSSGAPKKPRCNWEMHALQEIRRFQKSVDLLIP